jgi:hypothetical protein
MDRRGKGWTLFALAAAVAIPAVIRAQARQVPTGAVADQQAITTQGKGGRPGGGGGSTITGPITLGAPGDMGCRWTEAYGINAAAVPLVAGMAGGCGNPYNKPFIWSAPTGAATGNSTGVWARAASDNGIVVGMGPGQEPVIFDDNGAVQTVLTRPKGYTTGEATSITSDGTVIVGFAYSVAENGKHPFLWQRTSTGWGEGEPIPSNGGWAWGVTRVGDELRIVGAVSSGGRHGAALWSRTSSGWTLVQLNADSDANAVNATATVIAGTRKLPLPGDPTRTYYEHVVWVDQGADGWQVATLKGADPNFDEGEALGIADQPDGSTVVVGYSWQNTSGTGGTQWAVAWTRAAGATAFGSPKLLPPLSKKWGATASGVNSRGEVVGAGSTGSSSNAVMWKLR